MVVLLGTCVDDLLPLKNPLHRMSYSNAVLFWGRLDLGIKAPRLLVYEDTEG